VKSFTRGLLWVCAILGAIGVLLYLFVFDVWTVPKGPDDQFGASLLPTMRIEDKVLIQRGRRPIYGELARCMSPVESATFVVGRVFGRAGDKVEVTDQRITTNGQGLAARHGCDRVVVPHPVTQNLITLNCGVAETGAWSFSYLTERRKCIFSSSACRDVGLSFAA